MSFRQHPVEREIKCHHIGGYIKYYTSNGRGLNVCCIEGPKDSLAINDAYPAIEKMFNAPRKAGSKSKYAR